MSAVRTVVYDANMQRQIMRGDTLCASEVIPATNNSNALTITAAMLGGSFIARNPSAAAADTIDTAANIINALNGGIGNQSVQAGSSFRVRWLVSTAFATTVAAQANSGVTVTNGAIAASSWKDFLVTVVNPTPQQTIPANTTNGSAVVTGMNLQQTSLLSVGMVVTNAVNGLQGATITGVQAGVGVTLSANANATSTFPVALTFSPTITVQGIGQGAI
jgi:hypothetical protein